MGSKFKVLRLFNRANMQRFISKSVNLASRNGCFEAPAEIKEGQRVVLLFLGLIAKLRGRILLDLALGLLPFKMAAIPLA